MQKILEKRGTPKERMWSVVLKRSFCCTLFKVLYDINYQLS